MKIQIAIVSEQLLPNLIPLLMDKPKKAFLLSSDEMARRGNTRKLVDELRRMDIDTIVRDGMPDANMKAIQEFSLQLAADIRENHPDAEITLNATGGNKLMSMGLVDVWKGEANKIIYVDTAHRRIEMLPDGRGHVEPSIAMGNDLDVPTYLRVQGFNYARSLSDEAQWGEAISKRKEICKLLAKNAEALTGLISDMNRMANNAVEEFKENGKKRERLSQAKQEFSATPRKEYADALHKMVDAGLLRWEKGRREMEFIDMEALRFLSGGWLEEYAWHVLHDEKLHDVRMSVNVTDMQSRNEFDVLACHQNQLLFIECKTLRYNSENDNEIAYKVDSLGQDARGLFGETWLLTARKPTDILKDRAKKARIRIIGPEELPKLRDIVREWRG